MAAPNDEETFDFRTVVPVEGKVEEWMTAVEEEMCRTLRAITKEAVFLYASSKRVDWIDANLGMVTTSGSQIWWTWHVEDSFR
jgi:dynein heavy chain